jgi:hypothetical protein
MSHFYLFYRCGHRLRQPRSSIQKDLVKACDARPPGLTPGEREGRTSKQKAADSRVLSKYLSPMHAGRLELRGMIHLRNFVCLGMALFVLSVPILACALPGQEMSEEEQTCCLHMADECGSSQMGESHSCCNKLPQLGASVLQVTSKHAPVTLDYAVQVAPDLQPNVPTMVTAVFRRVITPPESPPGQPPVLRI